MKYLFLFLIVFTSFAAEQRGVSYDPNTKVVTQNDLTQTFAVANAGTNNSGMLRVTNVATVGGGMKVVGQITNSALQTHSIVVTGPNSELGSMVDFGNVGDVLTSSGTGVIPSFLPPTTGNWVADGTTNSTLKGSATAYNVNVTNQINVGVGSTSPGTLALYSTNGTHLFTITVDSSGNLTISTNTQVNGGVYVYSDPDYADLYPGFIDAFGAGGGYFSIQESDSISQHVMQSSADQNRINLITSKGQLTIVADTNNFRMEMSTNTGTSLMLLGPTVSDNTANYIFNTYGPRTNSFVRFQVQGVTKASLDPNGLLTLSRPEGSTTLGPSTSGNTALTGSETALFLGANNTTYVTINNQAIQPNTPGNTPYDLGSATTGGRFRNAPLDGKLSLDGKTNLIGDNGSAITFNGVPYGVPFNVVTQAYSATISLDLSTNSDLWMGLTGDVTLSGTAHAASKLLNMRVDADSSNRTLTCPSTWHYMSGSTNITLLANKVGMLTLKSYGTTEGNVVASWISE